jgi:hypothetical protein
MALRAKQSVLAGFVSSYLRVIVVRLASVRRGRGRLGCDLGYGSLVSKVHHGDTGKQIDGASREASFLAVFVSSW